MIAILINAIVISMMYFPEFTGSSVLEGLDSFFILFFLVEAIVKIRNLRPSGYFSNNWNRFDFFLVMVSLPSLLPHVMEIPDASVLLILRVFRLIRVLRFIRFVPHITKILSGLGRALRASVFVLVAMLFLDFILALFTCHFYGNLAPEYFGNPLVSAYSIFQMFTVEGWHEIPAAIAEESNSTWFIGLTRFYFVVVVLLGGVFGMSLANAVFVDEMTLDNNDVLETKIDDLNERIEELKLLIEKNK